MNTEQPMKSISCLITSYNCEKSIGRAIKSVLMQIGYFRLEIIVVDDGSTDRSRDEIQRFGNSGGRIKTFFRDHEGLINTFIYGLRQCTGDYICFCDCDDYYLPGALQTRLEFMERHPDIGLLGTSVILAGSGNISFTDHPFIPVNPVKYWASTRLPEQTFLIRKTTFDKLKIIEKIRRFRMHDLPIVIYFSIYSQVMGIKTPTAVQSIRARSFSHPFNRRGEIRFILSAQRIRLYFLLFHSFNLKTLFWILKQIVGKTLKITLAPRNKLCYQPAESFTQFL